MILVLLSEAEIAAGIRHAYFEEQVILEGGGAVGIAALLAGKVTPGEQNHRLTERQKHRHGTAPQDHQPGDISNVADITILTEAELRSQVQLDLAAIDCVEQAFRRPGHQGGGHAADHAPRHHRKQR